MNVWPLTHDSLSRAISQIAPDARLTRFNVERVDAHGWDIRIDDDTLFIKCSRDFLDNADQLAYHFRRASPYGQQQ